MAKAVRWKVDFESTIDKIPYRIAIYDEGWSTYPIDLIAGPSPIVTDEDNSVDYFEPIRIQTGVIQVCSRTGDDTVLSLDDILPENNISRPVQLIRTDTNTIEWQGFLSCEVYNQDYISTPQILNIPIISVLEAMASVQVDITRSSGLQTINKVLYNAINEISIQSGMTLFTDILYPRDTLDVFNKYLDQTVFYNRKEYNNENSTTYIISGMSSKDVIERICKFMGWVAREEGTSLYLTRLSAEFGLMKSSVISFNADASSGVYVPKIYKGIDKLIWRGTQHQKSVNQGAKSVEVIANLKKYELGLSLPEFPIGEVTTVYRQLWNYKENGDWLYLIASRDLDAYSNIEFAFYSADANLFQHYFANYQPSVLTQVLTHMSVGLRSSILDWINSDGLTLIKFYAGAFLSRYCWEKTGDVEAHDAKDALYCIFFPGSSDWGGAWENSNFEALQVGPIFTINNVTHYRCHNGYLQLDAAADTIFTKSSNDYTGLELTHTSESAGVWKIGVELQFGDKWWNGTSWQDSQCLFGARMTKNNFESNWVSSMEIVKADGLLIPITEEMQGLVVLKIWPVASYTLNGNAVLEMIFQRLSVNHLVPDKATETDRGENHYFELLGTNFRNEVTISTDISTYLNNESSPSLLMNTAITPTRTINYYLEGGTQDIRPEKDLLNRLSEYYKQARQILKLKVAHPTNGSLSSLHLQGINDGKKYIPLAESRDWKEDVSTIDCMEIPN